MIEDFPMTIHGMFPDECADAILVMNTYLSDLLKQFESENSKDISLEDRLDLIRSTLDTVREVLEVNHSIREYLYQLEEKAKQDQPLALSFTISAQ